MGLPGAAEEVVAVAGEGVAAAAVSEGAAGAAVDSEAADRRVGSPEAAGRQLDRGAAGAWRGAVVAVLASPTAGLHLALPEAAASEAALASETGRRCSPARARRSAEARELETGPRSAQAPAGLVFLNFPRLEPADLELALPTASVLAPANGRAHCRDWGAAQVVTAFKTCRPRAKTASPVFRIAWPTAAIG